ncbi:FAD-dependent oxidoreductase [Altericista sp. CCNU0014]|uniref:FAD-dependent oxidoreductase n=1 Tax=Altericista sp. CCNU0014 TaxID=3082949 RepID=UPI00384FC2BA
MSNVDLRLKLNLNVQLLLGEGKQTYGWIGDRHFTLTGISGPILRDIAALADKTATAKEIQTQLTDRYPPAYVAQIIEILTKAQCLISDRGDAIDFEDSVGGPASRRADGDSTILDRPIVVLGNRELLAAMVRGLKGSGFRQVRAVYAERFASCFTEAFQQQQETIVSSTQPVAPVFPSASFSPDRTLSEANESDLQEIFQGAALAICALEGMPFQALFDVNRVALSTATPCLFVTATPSTGTVGPTVVGGLSACFRCRAMAIAQLPAPFRPLLPHLRTPLSLGQDRHLLETVAQRATEEAIALLSHPPRTQYAAHLRHVGALGESSSVSLLPQGDCPACSPLTESPLPSHAHAAAAAAATEIMGQWTLSPTSTQQPDPDAYRTVGILGGGTAGYLTALTLRALRPELEVTLIESSDIPIIGVGEATTPELVRWLHSPRFLNRDIGEFFRQVQPTWKLGIKFAWGSPGDDFFTFPFQRGRLLESQLYESTLNQQSLGSLLMSGDRTPIFDDGTGDRQSWLHLMRWAYHLDNQRFVRYLQKSAAEVGVKYIDAKVADVLRAPDGETVETLITEDGQRLSYDLYVDCSGFRSVLMGKALGSPFVSYGDTLFTDRAITATVPHNGTIKPYTLAETMDSGWCWNIPFADTDHRGYVYSSAFMSEDAAIAEMQAKNPGMGEPHFVKFRSGRHEHFWKGNVVAIGNSYAFVEPLESTALHAIVLELDLLATHFPASRHDRSLQPILNRKMNERWDALRWFLGIHYRFNRRLDTPFWKAANHEANISGAEMKVARFQDRAPLSYQNSLFYTLVPPEFFSDDHSFDTLLMGQQVPARFANPTLDKANWERQISILRHMARQALPQHEALQWLQAERPDLLYEFVRHPDSWIHRWLPS